MPLSPATAGGPDDPGLAAEVEVGQSHGQVAVGAVQQSSRFVVGPTQAHEFLRFKLTEGLPFQSDQLSGGSPPLSGEPCSPR